MDQTSVDAARRDLTDFTRCAACGTPLTSGCCGRCGLDLSGPDGARIADASRAAARALDHRYRVIDLARAAQVAATGAARPPTAGRPAGWSPLVPPGGVAPSGAVPVVPVVPGVPVAGPPAAGAWPAVAAGAPPRALPGAVAVPAPAPSTHGPGGLPAGAPPNGATLRPAPWSQPVPARSFDVARLYALAGAGLVAASALVFAFFVLDEAPAARVAVLLLATVLAAAGTLMLRRTGITSSAEAVGGLVVALAVVDVWVVAELAGERARWLVLAFLLLSLGVGLPAAGRAARVRSWTVAVLVLPVVPVAAAGWVQTPWGLHLALIAASLVTLVRVPHRRVVDARFGPSTPWIDVLLTVAAAGFLGLALLSGLALPAPAPGWRAGGLAVALLLGAVVAEVHARFGQATAWTSAAGALAVVALAVAPVGLVPAAIGTGPVAGACAWVLLVLLPTATGRDVATDVRYRARVSGGWLALVASAAPGALVGVGATLGLLGALGDGLRDLLDPAAFDQPGSGAGTGPVLALVVLAGALGTIARLRLAPVPRVLWTVPGPTGGGTETARPGLPVYPGTTAGRPVPVASPVPALREPVVVTLGRACWPPAAVLAVWAAIGLLHAWSPALLVAEVLLAVALVEGARRVAARVVALPGTPAPAPAAPTTPAPPVPASPVPAPLAPAPVPPALAPAPAPVPAPVPALAGTIPVPGAPVEVPPLRAPWHGTLVGSAFVQIVLVAALGWVSRPTLAIGAVAVVLLLLRSRRLVAVAARGVLVGLAAAYAGIVLSVLLAGAGWDGYGVVGGTAVALTLTAVVLTVLPGVGRDSWLAVLVVTVVPASLGILAVGIDRTWWSAAVAAALLGLEVVLLGTRSQPVAPWLRVLAAALVVPTVSVVLICAGALLLPGSGSPVLLPVVGVLAAGTAVAAPAVADTLRRRRADVPAEPARVALELSAAGTAAVALLLALVRDTTGADTVLVLCAVLAAGATAVARRGDRHPVWWAASLLWTGVVWSALAWVGVGLVEAYTIPAAGAALVVGTVLVRRGDRWLPLVQAGAVLLVAPTLLLAVAGNAVGLRSAVLLAFAALAVGIGLLGDADRTTPDQVPAGAGTTSATGTVTGAATSRADASAGTTDARALRSPGASRALSRPLLVAGAAAALAGTVRAVHLVASTPPGSEAQDARLFAAALAWSSVGAALLGAAGMLLARERAARVARLVSTSGPGADEHPEPAVLVRAARRAELVQRWALAPALVAGTVGTLVAIRSTWAATWTAWAVELALLLLAVAAVRAEVTGRSGRLARFPLPPGWFLWLGALAWAIGAWSTRLLRVEVFALPLGIALTLMGFVALRQTLTDPDAARPAPAPTPPPAPRPAGSAWPVGYRGSVATLTPGIVATLGPSMLAIWTDPMTWRAVLVVVLALVFMMFGARQLLRAPLVVGAVSLGVGVLSVFAAQIGRTISAGPWLLTLLATGGLLLVLAIFAERRRAGQSEEGAPVRVLR